MIHYLVMHQDIRESQTFKKYYQNNKKYIYDWSSFYFACSVKLDIPTLKEYPKSSLRLYYNYGFFVAIKPQDFMRKVTFSFSQIKYQAKIILVSCVIHILHCIPTSRKSNKRGIFFSFRRFFKIGNYSTHSPHMCTHLFPPHVPLTFFSA